MADKQTEKIPGFSQGVRDNAAVRMVKLVAPVCPNSQRKRNSDGSWAEVGQNCQLAGGKWWIDCEAREHDPYFTTRTYYETVDVVDDDGFIVGAKKKPVTVRRPNIVQVPLGRRHHSGNGVKISMEKKGRRRLSDFGFEEVCQFRNCQNPVNPKYSSPAFGAYCSFNHMGLIAADAQEIMLPQINGVTEGPNVDKVRQRRAKMLRDATVSAIE